MVFAAPRGTVRHNHILRLQKFHLFFIFFLVAWNSEMYF